MGKITNKLLSLVPAFFMAACLGNTPVQSHETEPLPPSPDSYTAFNSQFDTLPDNFGAKDDRVKITDGKAAPWAAIGKLDIGYELPCTATMVGPDILATAGHCAVGSNRIQVPELDGEIIIPDRKTTFAPGHVNGKSEMQADVVMFFRPNIFYEKRHTHDYAFALLSKPLGNKTGWLNLLKAKAGDIATIKQQEIPLYQAGYSGDAPDEMTANIGCHVTHIETDGFFHDCDTLPGDSGSPIIIQKNGSYQIAGINHSISSLPDNFNLAGYAVPVSVMGNQLKAFQNYAEKQQLNSPGEKAKPLQP